MIEISRLCSGAPTTGVRRADSAQWDGLVLKLRARDPSLHPGPAGAGLAPACRSRRLASLLGASPAVRPCRNVWLEADLERLISDLQAFACRLTGPQPAEQTRAVSAR